MLSNFFNVILKVKLFDINIITNVGIYLGLLLEQKNDLEGSLNAFQRVLQEIINKRANIILNNLSKTDSFTTQYTKDQLLCSTHTEVLTHIYRVQMV